MKYQYQDDSDITKITILPDGRIYLFGVSESVLEVINSLDNPGPTINSVQNRPDSTGQVESGVIRERRQN